VTEEFHSRFHVEVPLDVARKRFVNRALNRVFGTYMRNLHETEGLSIKREIATALGEYYSWTTEISTYLEQDFCRCLIALETLYNAVPDYRRNEVEQLIMRLFVEAETDLDVRWQDGAFYPAGAKELDEILVNYNLDWLKEEKLDVVRKPYRKGLVLFLEARSDPERLTDVITDMYEAFEGMIKVITGKSRVNRDAREVFFEKLGAKGLVTLSKEYGEYAHSIRHAVDPSSSRITPNESEVEAFVYLTGVFLRLAAHEVRSKGKGENRENG